jgi:hypothetical protein
LKKRSKKLLLLGAQPVGCGTPRGTVFWFFFSKKNRLLLFPTYRHIHQSDMDFICGGTVFVGLRWSASA